MTYYDRREGREKALPDCGCAGLVWDPQTQRCERPMDFMSVLNGKQGLGFYSPSFEGDDFYDYDYGYDFIDGGYFGGWDWSYSAGGDGNWWDNFDPITGDYIGGGAADDWSWWDNFDPITGDYIGSGDTIFVGQTDAESPLPTVGGYNWQDFIDPWNYTPPDLPWNPWGDITGGEMPTAPGGQPLPGYCPAGTYHPYPIGHARQDECAPFPTDPNARRQAQQREQQRQQQARQAQQQRQQQQPQGAPCPRGQYRDQTTRRCVPIPTCPQGMVFSPVSQKCVPKTAASSTSSLSQLAKSPWLWILLVGGALLASDNGSSSGGRRGRR